MMQRCWAQSIRGRCGKLLAVLVVAAMPAASQGVDPLVRAYRKTPTVVNQRSLLRYADAHPKDSSGALALLALGSVESDGKDYALAARHLRNFATRLPQLADYGSYYLGLSQVELKDYGQAVKTLPAVWQNDPGSPLANRAILLAARAYTEDNKPGEALKLLKANFSKLPQPQTDAQLGAIYEAAGDRVAAAVAWQRVYYNYPASREADEAASALPRLKMSLGDAYPPPMPTAILNRTKRLAESGEGATARKELEAAIPGLGGAEREIAQVRIGGLIYQTKDYKAAYRYFQNLQVSSEQADAERLFQLFTCARRLDMEAEMQTLETEVSRKYPHSPWRLETLLSSVEYWQRMNRPEIYLPALRACVDQFPQSPQAAGCHWNLAFSQYISRQNDAAALLKAHLERYPRSEKATAAMYFLGRLAESTQNAGEARSWYNGILERFPNYYYSIQARERLGGLKGGAAGGSTEVQDFLAHLDFPKAPKLSFEPSTSTQKRLERAKLLRAAGIDDWADAELRFGARNDGQPQVLAVELAQQAQKQGSTDQSIRWIKSLVPGYLQMPINSAPTSFWKLAFPLPYRESLERNSRQRSLDPYVVAGLIRQESEFNPAAVSVAKAVGLTQVMPSTGREISRKVGIPRFNTAMLKQPEVNLKLGTYFLRRLLDSLNGRWEETLAAYNGGPTRVTRWRGWNEFREPAEFIESIPIQETREYVMSVLRNAHFYRTLYAGEAAPAQKAVASAATKATPVRTVANRRPARRVSSSAQ